MADKNAQTATSTTTAPKRTRKAPNPAVKQLRAAETSAPREIQETFRTTIAEHNDLIDKAGACGYQSMSDFFRGLLGLDPPRAGLFAAFGLTKTS